MNSIMITEQEKQDLYEEMPEYEQKINYSTLSLNAIFFHYSVYGSHDAAVEICDRANRGDSNAENLAGELFWE